MLGLSYLNFGWAMFGWAHLSPPLPIYAYGCDSVSLKYFWSFCFGGRLTGLFQNFHLFFYSHIPEIVCLLLFTQLLPNYSRVVAMWDGTTKNTMSVQDSADMRPTVYSNCSTLLCLCLNQQYHQTQKAHLSFTPHKTTQKDSNVVHNFIWNTQLYTVKNGVSFHWFKYNTLGCCIGFHGNISVKARIPRKRFDVDTQILVAIYANTIVETILRKLRCELAMATRPVAKVFMAVELDSFLDIPT